jgi:diaminohydroxyphosphoribosylaminopyrimidine deaminase/5-amino-6-(5-phosphoribosylamino)uracil reductase
MQHSKFMRSALQEAAKGFGATSPNPAVGALIVRNGRILSRGWHRRAGLPHAEIEALRSLADPALARGATLYVTLEPCSSHGRTPPCTDAILAAGFKRVVVGSVDPHPKHSGCGLDILRKHGVDVVTGVLESECLHLNRAFFKWITSGRPWVLAKAALSLDGRLTRPPGEGQWLTGSAARGDAHRLRAECDAILIGAGTLRADNPSLTIRDAPSPEGKIQPWRVVVTRGTAQLPQNALLFTDEHRDRTLVFRGKPLNEVLDELGQKYSVTSVLVEGGGAILGSLFSQNLADEACFYLAPMLCGPSGVAISGMEGGLPQPSLHLKNIEYKQLGPDLRIGGLIHRPC